MPKTSKPRGRWQPEVPLRSCYRSPSGTSRDERIAEQDAAAGGRVPRQVPLPDGRSALASVELKALPKSRRVYAYLRHADGPRTVNRYIGEATGETRGEALRDAWAKARAKGLLVGDQERSAHD